MLKINFGSGPNKLPGWLNVDRAPETGPDVVADLTRPLPFGTGTVDFIHSEDLFAYLGFEGGRDFLRECRRILKPTGVMRLLTPNLERFARMYLEQPERLLQTWEMFVGVPLKTRTACEVFNIGLHLAGDFHYDPATFKIVAAEYGFSAYEVEDGQGEHLELQAIDLRRAHESVSMYFECVPV